MGKTASLLASVLLIAGLYPVHAAAQSSDSVFAPAFEHFYNLEYDEAIADFREVTVAEPDNPSSWNHLAQGLFYASLFDAGMMGSDLLKSNDAVTKGKKLEIPAARDEELKSALAKAFALCNARLKADPHDTAALYQLGIALAMRANYAFLVHHDWLGGFKDANQSRKVHEQIVRLEPDNYDARLIPGTHEYLVGTLPFMVRVAVRTAGVSGNRDRGLTAIESVAARGHTAKTDAVILLSVLYRRENCSARAIPIMRGLSEQFPRNFLFRIELAKLYADVGAQKEAADQLQQIHTLISRNAPGYGRSHTSLIEHQESDASQLTGLRAASFRN